LVARHLPDYQDAGLAVAEMFPEMQRHRGLADLRLVIARKIWAEAYRKPRHFRPSVPVQRWEGPSK
jgi:hypothetical protein